MATELKPKNRRSLSSLSLGFSNLSETLLPLLRGMVLARLLAPDQFGLAVTVTIVASIAELISELGVSQLALRMEEQLGTLHSLAVIRGLTLGCLIALSGPVFASMFNTPQTTWIYGVAGLASVLRGFSHLEPKARMRAYDYTPEAASILSGQAIWTFVSIGLAFVMPDYRAMVIGLVASAGGSMVMTHLMSSGPYRLAWNRDVISSSIRFGRPLVLNGIALSIAGLGDRFLIASRIGLAPLAQYTALASAAFLPRSAVTRFLVSLFTPQFVNAATPADQRRLSNIWLMTLATLGGGFGLCFIAAGRELVTLAFGHKYVIDQDLINLVSLLACIRYMATAPLAPSMALGRTGLVLANTATAASGLVLGAILIVYFPNLHVLVGAMIVGEGLSLAWILSRLRSFVTVDSVNLWLSPLIPASLISLIIVCLTYWPDSSTLFRYGICSVALSIQMVFTIFLLVRSHLSLGDVVACLFPRHHRAVPIL